MSGQHGIRSTRHVVAAALLLAGGAVAVPQFQPAARAQAVPLRLAPNYIPVAIDSPEPAVGSAFGNGPLISAGDLDTDGKHDIVVVQPGDGDGKVFVFSGATGALLYKLTAPDPSTAGAAARFGQYVGKLRDVGSCPGGQPGQQCTLPAIAPGDGVAEIMVSAINVDLPLDGGGTFTDLGRGYVFDGATGALLKRIDMPAQDVAHQASINPRPRPMFARAVLSPESPYPETADAPVHNGDMNGDGTADIVVGASHYYDDAGSNPECDPGPCSMSGRAYFYSGADIAGTDPAESLNTPYLTIPNPMPQTDNPFNPPTTLQETFGHSLVPIGDVGACSAAGLDPGSLCPQASTTNTPDGRPDVVITGHWTDYPDWALDSGVAWLVDGVTGTVLVRYDHPRPQRGALWSFTLSNQPAVGNVAGNVLPDVVLPSYAQHVQYAGQGQGYVMNGDFKARGDLVTLAIVNDPTPEPGGNFAVTIAGIGDVTDDPRNEILVGAWGPVTPGDDQTIINDVHVYSPLRQRVLLTLESPSQQAGAGFGTGLAPIGDVNDDGYIDFAVGESFYSGSLQRQGRVYIFRSTEEPPGPVDVPRTITLRLRGHLRASGAVTASESSCVSSVPVVIKRNGTRVKTTTTDSSGAFAVRLRDRPGRYQAVAKLVELEDFNCLKATSPRRAHRH